MAKRFTDSKKWKKDWFRTLPMKAKIVWQYLCDECEFYGVWSADYGIASFQVDFKFSETDLRIWFGDRVHFFDGNKVLIVPFYEFQYGESKDSWTAKIRAKEKLESLGFIVENNRVTPPSPDSGTTVVDSGTRRLIEGEGEVKGEVKVFKEGGVGETKLPALAELWNLHCGKLSKVIGTNKTRNIRIKERMSEEPDIGNWALVIQRIANSDFCNGKSDKGWKADFDWLLQPEVRLKVLEGKYDNRESGKKDSLQEFMEGAS